MLTNLSKSVSDHSQHLVWSPFLLCVRIPSDPNMGVVPGEPVCHLPLAEKPGIHPRGEHLSKVPVASGCEHLPTSVGCDHELQSGPHHRAAPLRRLLWIWVHFSFFAAHFWMNTLKDCGIILIFSHQQLFYSSFDPPCCSLSFFFWPFSSLFFFSSLFWFSGNRFPVPDSLQNYNQFESTNTIWLIFCYFNQWKG